MAFHTTLLHPRWRFRDRYARNPLRLSIPLARISLTRNQQWSARIVEVTMMLPVSRCECHICSFWPGAAAVWHRKTGPPHATCASRTTQVVVRLPLA
eukprot:2889028-Rhodomonas_salina.3